MDVRRVFADNVIYFMEKKNIDRMELSERIGAKYTTVCSWLACEKFPRVDSLTAISSVLGVSVPTLFDESVCRKVKVCSECGLEIEGGSYLVVGDNYLQTHYFEDNNCFCSKDCLCRFLSVMEIKNGDEENPFLL